MVNSRMLKELQNLAPWTWDKKCEMHPPGTKALHDFEKVEHYQRSQWPKPPAARPRKPSMKKEAARLAAAAMASVQHPLDVSEGQSTLSGDKAPSSPLSSAMSAPSGSVPPTPMSATTSSATAASTPFPSDPPSDPPTSAIQPSCPAITPAVVSMITPITTQTTTPRQRPAKASVMPRRLSLGAAQQSGPLGKDGAEKAVRVATERSKAQRTPVQVLDSAVSQSVSLSDDADKDMGAMAASPPPESATTALERDETTVPAVRSAVSDGVASKVTTPLGATERSDKGVTIEPCRKVEVREAQSSLSVVRQVVTKPTMPASQPISKAPTSVVKTPSPATAKPAATSEGVEDYREIEIKQAKKAPMQAIPAPVVHKPTVEPSIPAAQRSLKAAVPVAQSAPLSVVTPEAAKSTEAAVGGVEAVVVEPRRNAAVKEAQRAQSPRPSAAAAVVNAAAKPAMPSIKRASSDAVVPNPTKPAVGKEDRFGVKAYRKLEAKDVQRAQPVATTVCASPAKAATRLGGPTSQPFKAPRPSADPSAGKQVAPQSQALPAAVVEEKKVWLAGVGAVACAEGADMKVCAAGRVKAVTAAEEGHGVRAVGGVDGSGKVWANKAPRSTTTPRKPLAVLSPPPRQPPANLSSPAPVRQPKRPVAGGTDENAAPRAKKPRVLLVPASRATNGMGERKGAPSADAPPPPQTVAVPEGTVVVGQGLLQALAAQEDEGGKVDEVMKRMRPMSIVPIGRHQSALLGSSAGMTQPHASLLAALTPSKRGPAVNAAGTRSWVFGETMRGAFSILRQMDSRSGWKY